MYAGRHKVAARAGPLGPVKGGQPVVIGRESCLRGVNGNKLPAQAMYAVVMFSRLMLAILLLSSHALVLRGAVVPGPQREVIAEDACCPLCVPAEDGRETIGCGCGCGALQDDSRLPDAPRDLATLVSRGFGLPAPEQAPLRLGSVDVVHVSQCVGVHDDAAGHTNTMRFLARVGHWLN